jgi:hypothetical protein
MVSGAGFVSSHGTCDGLETQFNRIKLTDCM